MNGIEGFVDPLVFNSVRDLVQNATSLRSRFIDSMFDRRRNIYNECGFPSSGEITVEQLWKLYEREAVAQRVVNVWPSECWKVLPEVYETEDSEIDTPFEQALNLIGSMLAPEPGYHKEDKGSILWDYLYRADVDCGIGRYGVILLGIDDGLPLDQPAVFSPNTTAARKLNFMRVFPENLAQIASVNNDQKNRRYGQPEYYNITFTNPEDVGGSIGIGLNQTTARVHWSRCVHIVDNVTSNEIIGTSRLKAVLNNVLSIQKLYAGEAEMYWLGAFPGISFETHPQLGGDVAINKDRAKSQIEQYFNGLQRYLLNVGMSAKMLAPTVVDAQKQLENQVGLICMALKIPIPVFKGYEIGEQASTNNESDHDDRTKERQNRQVTARVICPTINRLINLGVLPKPNGYYVNWPEITEEKRKDKVDNNSKRVTSFVAYLNSPMKDRISLKDYLTKYDTFTDEEAEAIILNQPQVTTPEQVIENPNEQAQQRTTEPSQSSTQETARVDEQVPQAEQSVS